MRKRVGLAIAVVGGLGILAGLVVAALAASAGAQELTDRIAAVVDKAPIFASDVDKSLAEELYMRRLRGEPGPADSAGLEALRRELLESLIDRRVVLAGAEKEGIEVTGTEVEDGVDQWLADLTRSVGSDKAFAAELERQGVTLDDFKSRYRKDVEEQLYVSKFMRKEFASVGVAEADLERFFQAKYDSVPSLPEVVGIAHIMIVPVISAAKEEAVHNKVSAVLGRLEAGEAFDKVAREVSDEERTRSAGGEIGLVAPADLQPEVAAAVAGLEAGEISEPVRTKHGIEIVKLEDKSGDRYQLRHIFVRFVPEMEDTARASRLAEEVRSRAVAGEAFETLAREYSDDEATRESGGYLGEVETPALDPAYAEALAGLNPGDISSALRTAAGYQILKLVSRTAARKPAYDEAAPWIRNLIESRRRQEKFDAWLKTARQEIYVKEMQ
jgi:peptidyl-prolyl cis-trans isomerase SurA